jgi:hypothetical protein
MKSATLPAIRVEPELRRQAERLLGSGESLSTFVEAAVRDRVAQRAADAEFLARGLASLEAVRNGAPTASATSVVAKLQGRLAAARRKAAGTRARGARTPK